MNKNILGGNVMNMSFIIMERNCGAIDADYFSCCGYYIIKFFSSPYTLQADLIIGGLVISSCEMVFEGTYFFPININYNYYVLQEKSITKLFIQ